MAKTIISDDNGEPKFALDLPAGNVRLEHMRHRLSSVTAEHVFVYGDKPEEKGQQRLWLDCGEPPPPTSDHPMLRDLPPLTDSTASVSRTLGRVARKADIPITLRKVNDRTLEITAPAGHDLQAHITRLNANLVQGRVQGG